MTKIIDTHIHLADISNFNTLNDLCIAPAILQSDWKKLEKLYLENPHNIIPAFGLHPWYIRDASKNWEQELESLLIKYPFCLVGETGLDRHRDEQYSPQNDFFKIHIKLAIKYNRPLLIHAVKCTDWLDEYWETLSQTRFVIHSYNARRELLKKIISAGGYVSFSNSILNNREKDKILQAVPLDRIMIETDGPYQSGELKQIGKDISKILNLTEQEFFKIAYDNTIRFLNFSATKI